MGGNRDSGGRRRLSRNLDATGLDLLDNRYPAGIDVYGPDRDHRRPDNFGRQTMRAILLALALAVPASAQFELLVLDATGPRTAPPVYDLGTGYSSDTLSARF